MNQRRLLRIFFFSVFAVICFEQCYLIMRDFLEYPVVIDMFDVSPSLMTILPGITLCNNNRLSLKKLINRNATIRTAMDRRFPGWPKNQHLYHDRDAHFTAFRDEVAKMFEELDYNPQDEMDNATMEDLFELKPENKPYLKWFGCARTWTDSIECDQLTKIDSIQDRRCTTILHRGSMLYDLVHRPQLFNSTRASTGHYSYFDAKEVIKIVVDFDPEDYADLKRQIGSRVIFHDNNFVGFTTNLDYFITRGYKYDFNIDRKDIKFKEHIGECVDYDKENLPKYKSKIDPRIPMMVDTCFQNCVVQNVINYSDCWPPTMPYFRNDSFNPSRSLKSCLWFRGFHQIPLTKQKPKNKSTHSAGSYPVVDDYLKSRAKMNMYKKIKQFCWSQCALACKFSAYSITVTRSIWPTDVQILFDKTGHDQKVLRHCCALVTVKYTHFHYTVQEYKLKYNWPDTLGNLGGLLAVWLGISIVSLYRGVQKLVEVCTRGSSSARVHVHDGI